MISISKARFCALFSGFLTLLFLPDPARAAAVTHASHRAFYEISIDRVDAGSNIVDARGRMVTEWRRACDGWLSSQRLLVSMAPGEGEPINSEVAMTSFEALDGTLFSFDSETRVGGETVEAVKGAAERDGPGKAGRAVYNEPRGVAVDLPADTVFPFEHTIAVIEAAEKGQLRVFSHYFDGSQPENAPMTANSLILDKARDAAEGTGNGFGEISAHKWWPVRLAMFASNAHKRLDEEPEFEMTQILQDNGVVRRFEFDYGEFSLVAALIEIKEIDPPRCN
ncbi:MAG: hypothetical protein CMM26_10275 [Rhodospirillaceae bacterium]|nr:hypothetical protein [Rhodospirillaceae bacterium]|tara:strand:+ start:849 stop:1691 length:843 start_codon:yes stop_codon:yes gene_type:complete